ncbi:hypothetical protein XH90_09520 [Bradyrhizobium sp. CCBAU 53338]|nr:hypothetical protein XH90_09520 [Bradyrhizobium sp. CCBAU 53338]
MPQSVRQESKVAPRRMRGGKLMLRTDLGVRWPATPTGAQEGASLCWLAEDEDIEALTGEDPLIRNGAPSCERRPMAQSKACG